MSNVPPPDAFLDRTLEIFASIDSSGLVPPTTSRAPIPPSTRTLRDRKKASTPGSGPGTPQEEDEKVLASEGSTPAPQPSSAAKNVLKGNDLNSTPTASAASVSVKKRSEERKLPRVILKLGPQPSSSVESQSAT